MVGDGSQTNRLGRRASIVLAPPDEIPDAGDGHESDKDYGGVVDCLRSDGEIGRHAEEGKRKKRPS